MIEKLNLLASAPADAINATTAQLADLVPPLIAAIVFFAIVAGLSVMLKRAMRRINDEPHNERQHSGAVAKSIRRNEWNYYKKVSRGKYRRGI